MKNPKRIVLIGGGTGIYTLLSGLKKHDCILTSIVSMMDSGGSTGRLIDEFGTLPVGDIRRSIIALSENREIMRTLFEYRFKEGAGLKNHSMGNLILTALTKITGTEEEGINSACKILNVKGNVLPVTLEKSNLCAELENGEIVKGETNIDIPKHNSNLKIKRLFLEPYAFAHEKAIKAIKEADIIVLGPGDLYTSTIANLVVENISNATNESKAKKVYVCNLMTKKGETNNFTITQHLNELIKYLGKDCLDYVIYNSKMPSQERLDKYKGEESQTVKIDSENFKKFKAKFIGENLISETSLVRHNEEIIAKLILSLG